MSRRFAILSAVLVATILAISFALFPPAPSRAASTPAATKTPSLTRTPTSTRTPTNTKTPKPCAIVPDTLTPTDEYQYVFNITPTDTFTPTDTPSPIPCSSLTPSLTPNDTQAANTATKQSQSDDKTSAAAAVTATKGYVAQFKPLDPRELTSYAGKHIGEKVCEGGVIFNIYDDVIQMMMGGDYSQPLYITMTDTVSGVYVNDYVTICGTVDGFTTFQNNAGSDVTQPALTDGFVKGR